MRDAEQSFTRIEAIRKANSDPSYVNDRIYRLMYKEDLYIAAYEKIKSKPGNMTPGQDGTTLDEFSIRTIRNIINKMKDESFTFRGARRVLIPKANGKTRPLSVAPPTDKVVQEVIRSILEAIYEPTFSNNSHGFRAGKSCHTALKQVRESWSGVTWVIEGDIKGCFDNISHSKLIDQLRLRIKDERFINLIRKALNAGYFENGAFFSATLGTPQGSIISPILANVFLDQLDRKVEQLIKDHHQGEEGDKITDPAYRKLQRQKTSLRKKAEKQEGAERNATLSLAREANSKLLSMSPYLTRDNGFIRVKYVRYADDWIIGVNGPKLLAEELRSVVGEFLENAGLELSIEKTHIRHAKSETAKFLGTNLRIGSENSKIMKVLRYGKKFPKRVAGWTPIMYAPMNELIAKLHSRGFCDPKGNPTTVNKWIFLDDNQIVEQIGSVWRGIVNYYSFIDQFSMLSRIQFILQHAAAKTLATKHRSSRSKIFSKHGANLRVRIRDKAGKVIRQVEFPLIKSWKTSPKRFKIGTVDTNFLERSLRLRTRSKLYSPCVICESGDRVAMHHVKHIRKMGQEIKGFKRVLVSLNRKQIPVCHECHLKIHQGKYDGISLKDFALPHTAAA
ncbi:group II intron reverse transcriptase/nicotine-degrading enzyme NicA [Pseudomonas putida]|uniref:group II intron reverse transcriptase/nicotine-degrading enzyme NicA n=1 Tax=Pseudomonas putida TaxID=303 RepID=UPI003344692A